MRCGPREIPCLMLKTGFGRQKNLKQFVLATECDLYCE